MGELEEGLCGRVFNAGDVVNINEVIVDTVSDEVGTDINVFHVRVRLGIICAGDSTLVVNLSQYNSVGCVWGKPSSSKSEYSQRTWWAQSEHERYSASEEDSATTVCCFELQVMGPFAHSMRYLETDLQPSDIAQSESVKALKIG
jgi:hypothetical protein